MESATNLLERHSNSNSNSAGDNDASSGITNGGDSGLPSSVEMVNTPAAAAAVLGGDEEQDIFEQVTMILRKRRGWGPEDSLSHNGLDLDLLEDDDDELVEEDDAGCPLPSTPEDTQLIEAEVITHYQPGPQIHINQYSTYSIRCRLKVVDALRNGCLSNRWTSIGAELS